MQPVCEVQEIPSLIRNNTHMLYIYCALNL